MGKQRGCVCVRVKEGEVKLERMIGGIPVIFYPGYVYNLPIDHPRDIQSLEGTSTVDGNGENPAGLIWWWDPRAIEMDLTTISRDAVMMSRMQRERFMSKVRARINTELGNGHSDIESARVRRMKGVDPDVHLIEIYNSIVKEEEKIDVKNLPSRHIGGSSGGILVQQEKDAEGNPLDLPPDVCSKCGYKFASIKRMKDHKRAVHDARRSQAKKNWRENVESKSVRTIEERV